MLFARRLFYHPERISLSPAIGMPNSSGKIDIDPTDLRRRGATLPDGVSSVGAYQITFGNGQKFAGSTGNIILRLGGHARTWSDMTNIEFWPDHPGPPLAIDNPRLAHPADPLRRIDRDHPDIDPVIARMQWQDELLFGQSARRPPERPDQRQRTRTNFDRLADHADFAIIVDLLRTYLDLLVPAPVATEVENWVITALPSTMKTRFWHRLVCLSINNVEAVTIGEQFDGERWSTLGFVSANPSTENLSALISSEMIDAGVFLAPAWYQTVGPVYQIGFDNLNAFRLILEDDILLDLIGGLAMRLIRRGRGLYRRFHDYNLADLLLEGDFDAALVPAGREGFEPSDAL